MEPHARVMTSREESVEDSLSGGFGAERGGVACAREAAGEGWGWVAHGLD